MHVAGSLGRISLAHLIHPEPDDEHRVATCHTPQCLMQVVQDALSEDAGDRGDVTTLAT